MDWDRIGQIVAVLLLLAVVGGCSYMLFEDVTAETDARVACWECGWGRVSEVGNDWRCYGHDEFGAEVVRSVEWVQENACIGED